MTENFVTLLWLGPVWKTHFSYKPSTKCLEFSFYISLLLNYFCCLEIFYSIRLCLQFFSIDLLFLSNVHCLQWHLEVVLTQHKCSLFIQLHCPHLCPPNFLGFLIITINCRASYINANLFHPLTYWWRNCACNSYLFENLENHLGTILGLQYMALICRHLLLMLSINRDDKLKLPFILLYYRMYWIIFILHVTMVKKKQFHKLNILKLQDNHDNTDNNDNISTIKQFLFWPSTIVCKKWDFHRVTRAIQFY